MSAIYQHLSGGGVIPLTRTCGQIGHGFQVFCLRMGYHLHENKFNDCKDHRNKKEVPDPIVKDLISDKIRKRNKSKADLTVENFV